MPVTLLYGNVTVTKTKTGKRPCYHSGRRDTVNKGVKSKLCQMLI